MLIKNWIAVRKQNFTKPDGANDDTLESDVLLDEMFIINEMVSIIILKYFLNLL